MRKALLTVKDVKNFIFESFCYVGDTKILNRRQLGQELNIAVDTIDKFLKEGLPFILRGKRKFYNLVSVKRWLVEHDKLRDIELRNQRKCRTENFQ